ncbi:MAG: 2-amino-4-hydroxy-6-hydroxymethyldihydropteridine diphosphokinase [Hydrogenovibrio sp.]
MNQDVTEVFIGVGSNLSDPEYQVRQAFKALQALPETQWGAASDLYHSRPQGPQNQPDFVNAVVRLKTRLTPIALLRALQRIEREQGKVKQRHWGERLIDLDILLYGNTTLQTDDLIIPHPFMAQRDFVLLPLLALSPKAALPNGVLLADLAKQLDEVFVKPMSADENGGLIPEQLGK